MRERTSDTKESSKWRRLVLGAALGVAALVGAVETYDRVADYVDTRNNEISEDFKELMQKFAE